jgi:demethylmenaquinone methyltransferase/2-methoxy-6-polyprenyl-1,4-benzoquinol methylase
MAKLVPGHMKVGTKSEGPPVLPVPRTKEEAKRFYDRISRAYDYFAGVFEQKHAERALECLSINEGEAVLEIGFGSGHCLKRIAQSVGEMGKTCGIDISAGMLGVTKRRLANAQLADRVELCCGDAAKLPYGNSAFDAVFASFTLELFDTHEVCEVLEEAKRVLRPTGRLGIVSMSRASAKSAPVRLYEWAHLRWPRYVDCRPIYLEQSLINAGYRIRSQEMARMVGLPIEIIVATKATSN